KNAFFPEQPVTISEPFSLRGVQTVAVTVVPYQYNPVTKELRVQPQLQEDTTTQNLLLILWFQIYNIRRQIQEST
ncbi:MAG: hypothetical protein II041_03695, partial [Bacteroidales bacterium]|nr:hypothetical protein [Bacteroidales bacterium]